MKHISISLLMATVVCLTASSVFGQNISYLNEVSDPDKCKEISASGSGLTQADIDCALREAKLVPATASNYTYKRVIKYKEPISIPNWATTIYGDIAVTTRDSGYNLCLLTDYYKTGEIALIGHRISADVNCSQLGGFHGQVIAYYKDSSIKRKELWKYGKLDGVRIFYNQAGKETWREEYVNGNRIEPDKFSAPADSLIIGTWKYVEYYDVSGYEKAGLPRPIKRTATFIYAQNGVVESIHQDNVLTSRIKANWKYIPKNASSGVLEEYQGEDLIERGSVRWLSRNQLEYTVTFSQNPDLVGKQYVWTRQ